MSREGRTPEDGACGGGSVPLASRRLLGILVLTGIASGMLALAHRSWEEGAHRSRFRPPFRAAGARALRADGSVWRPETGGRPTVLIYVQRDCPHCEAELRRWDDLLSAGLPVPAPDVWVVARRAAHGDPWLPASLRHRVLHDSEGSTARALGAEIVPTTAYLEPGGTVAALTLGQTPRKRTRRLILQLLESSDDTRS